MSQNPSDEMVEPSAEQAVPPNPRRIVLPQRDIARVEMPSYEQIMQEEAMNNCFVKSVISGAMGGLLGVAFGVFTASVETSGGVDPISDADKTLRQVAKETWSSIKSKSWSYAKGFAYMGLVYSGVECVIEKYRAKHDKMNATYAGCAAGAILAYGGGPKAMCIGCASFAAFSTAIEHFLDR